MYRNCNFRRDKPLRVEEIQRKCNTMITACPGAGTTNAKRKKEVTPTRRSLRIRLKNRPQEADKSAQKEGPNAPGPSMFSDIWSVDNTAGRAMEDCSSSEPGGPTGEGTPSNTMSAPTATATRDGTGELPTHPSCYHSVMSLDHDGYSHLLTGLFVMAPQEAPKGDEEEEGSSDYKDALGEHFKANPSP